MVINEILKEKKMSRYKLSKLSGVPQTTIFDIYVGKTKLAKCEAGTLYKIAKALDMSVESLLEREKDTIREQEERERSFEIFKSNICHYLKDMGDLDFVINMLEKDEIRNLYDKQCYFESLYLLAMVDYVSRINRYPLCTNYNDIRKCKLPELVYPSSVLMLAAVTKDENVKKEALKNAIPEFLRFNIVESEVRNVI